ncbi:MAG: response regulator [Candidatus Sumerlaeota bacterium]|nr:response regulator [Candidatus Sumerlaeota bacterium]
MAAKKVLAVDDESDILLIIHTSLESEGFDVVTASNGFDALALAEEAKPDLIVLDIMMPEMDGFEVMKRLRDNPKTATIPIVMLTGLSERKLIKQALDMGVCHYIVKPFDFQDFLAVVNRAMKESQPDVFTV